MPKKLLRILNLWGPLLIWAGIIFSLSSRSLPQVTGSYWGDFTFKKLSHVFFYGVFGIFSYRALTGSGYKPQKAMMVSILMSFLYGVSDEIHQSFVPGRGPHARDIIFDTIGGTLGVWAKRYL